MAAACATNIRTLEISGRRDRRHEPAIGIVGEGRQVRAAMGFPFLAGLPLARTATTVWLIGPKPCTKLLQAMRSRTCASVQGWLATASRIGSRARMIVASRARRRKSSLIRCARSMATVPIAWDRSNRTQLGQRVKPIGRSSRMCSAVAHKFWTGHRHDQTDATRAEKKTAQRSGAR